MSFANAFSLGVQKQHARRFIGCLTLPASTELHVSGSVTLDVQLFADLIRRSRRSIRFCSSSAETSSYFSSIPPMASIYAPKFSALMTGLKPLGYPSGDKEFILPKLDTLEIYSTGFTEVQFKGIVQAIESRFTTNSRLNVPLRLGRQRAQASGKGIKDLEQDVKNQLKKAINRDLRAQFILSGPDGESDWDDGDRQSESGDEYYLYDDSS